MDGADILDHNTIIKVLFSKLMIWGTGNNWVLFEIDKYR